MNCQPEVIQITAPRRVHVKKSKTARPHEIVDKVCELMCIKRFDLFSKKRFDHLVQARMIISHILYNHPLYRMNLAQIGNLFERDHTSIIHYLKCTSFAEQCHPVLYDMMRIVYLEIFETDNIPNTYTPWKYKKAQKINYRASNHELTP